MEENKENCNCQGSVPPKPISEDQFECFYCGKELKI